MMRIPEIDLDGKCNSRGVPACIHSSHPQRIHHIHARTLYNCRSPSPEIIEFAGQYK